VSREEGHDGKEEILGGDMRGDVRHEEGKVGNQETKSWRNILKEDIGSGTKIGERVRKRGSLS